MVDSLGPQTPIHLASMASDVSKAECKDQPHLGYTIRNRMGRRNVPFKSWVVLWAEYAQNSLPSSTPSVSPFLCVLLVLTGLLIARNERHLWSESTIYASQSLHSLHYIIPVYLCFGSCPAWCALLFLISLFLATLQSRVFVRAEYKNPVYFVLQPAHLCSHLSPHPQTWHAC